jgi:uncharacterized protein (DUF934 family)
MSEPTPLLPPVKPLTVAPRVWTAAGFVADLWQALEDHDPLPTRGQVILPLTRWRTERTTAAAQRLDLGLLVQAGDIFPLREDDVKSVLVIALTFLKFSDGRPYSIAKHLRQRGYRGELRARGDVLYDQVPLMLRTGFDALEIIDAATLAALDRGQISTRAPSYQRHA